MLVEREAFLDSLSAQLGEVAATGRGRLVFLGGEAGVGKTSLMAAFAATAGAAGWAVRRGGCDNVTSAAALGPLLEAVPELVDVVEAARAVDRLRMFGVLQEVATSEPMLLLIEDIHWADMATLEMLRVLARRLDTLPMLVLATFREDEVRRTHPLSVLLGDLVTLPGVVRMQLLPLTVAGVRELARRAGSRLDVVELHRSTAGNPFYVSEVLAAGGERLPATVRDAVLARAERLSASARRVLAAAAVLGPRTQVPVLVAVCGEPSAAIDECVERGVLVDAGAELAFRHELARLAIEQTLGPAERATLHGAALRTLRAAGVGDDRMLAHHASGCGDQPAVLEYAPRAAARAARLGAHREAVQLYRLAVTAADPSNPTTGRLYAALSYECYLTDQPEDAHAARVMAMRLAEEQGDLPTVGAAQRWLSRLCWFLGRNEDSERWAARAIATLEPLGESAELAMAYSNMSQLRMLATDKTPAITWAERALALARRLADREVEMHALNNLGSAQLYASEPVDGTQRLARSLDMALADDAPEHAARAYTNLGSLAVTGRRFAEAEQWLRAGIAYCHDHDLDAWRLYMTAVLARALAEQGRYPAADALCAQVLRRPQLAPPTQIAASVVAGQLAMRRGEPVDFQDALAAAEATGEPQRLVPVAVTMAETAWLADDPQCVVAAVDRAWDALVAHPQPWELGELSWWLSSAGVRRVTPILVAAPFALLLDGAWQPAADEWLRLGCPLWAARALSCSPALTDARRALELVDALDAPAVRAALLRDRYAHGLPVPRGPRAASQRNPWGLTARELEVLALLAAGLSNSELARRLFLSQKTVGHQVSAILRKLGEPSRSRAVAAALRHGILAPT